MHQLRRTLLAFVAVAFFALPALCAAQAPAWPSKPIRFVVPFAAGGVADVVVRAVTPKLAEALGQPVIVENKGGAGGTLGTEVVAHAAPDGYTFVTPAASHTTTPKLYPKLGFDPVKDFVGVTQIARVPYLLVVNKSVPATTVQQFIAYAKANPGKLMYGSAGNGSSNHLAGELFESMSGTDMLHVPYKGSAPALIDVIAGHINFMFDAVNTSVQHIKAGEIKPLGIGTLQRSKLMPDVPTIAESGLPGFEAVTWVGVLAPAGTPKEIVERLNREIVKVLHLPEVQERLSGQGAEPVGSSPQEFDAYVRAEIDKWGEVIRKANIRPVQ
jgi:tripartite-type tricarboxylate transporter receptor subunit TctC